jgi:hypothetical protein
MRGLCEDHNPPDDDHLHLCRTRRWQGNAYSEKDRSDTNLRSQSGGNDQEPT